MKKLQLASTVVNKNEDLDQAVKTAATPAKIEPAPPKSDNILRKFMELPLLKKALIAGVFCAVVLGIGGGIGYYYVFIRATQDRIVLPTRIEARSLTTPVFASMDVPSATAPRDQPNPINGVLFTAAQMNSMKKRFPIAAMIENHIASRPQAGYNSADLVFETLAEGGITRTMAVFWSKSVDKIGPIRSARQYFVEWLLPFDPLYIHIGYAATTDPRTNSHGTIVTKRVKTLNKGGTFWRDHSRYAPHNAFTSTELLYKKAPIYGYTGKPAEITPWKFKFDAPLEERGKVTGATMYFHDKMRNNGLYDVTWKYDRVKNVYYRYNKSTPYTDVNTKAKVYAKNIILQKVKTASSYNAHAHMIINVTGKGDAVILRDGQAVNAKWKKSNFNSRTMYTDTDGNEIEFNRGIIWVVGVPVEQGKITLTK